MKHHLATAHDVYDPRPRSRSAPPPTTVSERSALPVGHEDCCRSSMRSWAYDGMAGRRTGRAGVRAARTGAVRRSQTQDNCDLASRWIASDLRDRDSLRGWRTDFWLDAERTQGCRSPSGSAVRAAQRHGRPGRGVGGAVAGRGEDLSAGDRCPDRSPKERTATGSTPTSPRSCTPTSMRRPRCSSSSGGRRRTGCEGSSASDLVPV